MIMERQGIDLVAWQALDDHQQTILTNATEHLDRHIATLSDAGAGPLEVTCVLGLAGEWDDSMRAIFSRWYKGETWRHVALGSRADELVVRLS